MDRTQIWSSEPTGKKLSYASLVAKVTLLKKCLIIYNYSEAEPTR